MTSVVISVLADLKGFCSKGSINASVALPRLSLQSNPKQKEISEEEVIEFVEVIELYIILLASFFVNYFVIADDLPSS